MLLNRKAQFLPVLGLTTIVAFCPGEALSKSTVQSAPSQSKHATPVTPTVKAQQAQAVTPEVSKAHAAKATSENTLTEPATSVPAQAKTTSAVANTTQAPSATTVGQTTPTISSVTASPSKRTAPTTSTTTSAPSKGTTSTTNSVALAAPDPKEIEHELDDLADTLKRTYNAANSILLECSRAYNADALDNVMMDPWMEGQPGLAHVGSQPFPGALKPLPPRKKWLDHDQSQLTQILRMLTKELDSINSASSLDTSFKVSLEIMQDNLHQIDSQFARLNSLTNPTSVDGNGQPAYDKVGIGRAAQAIKDESSGLNDIRKRLLRQLREFEKH